VDLFNNALLVHLGFLLSKKRPKALHEACDLAMQIEANILWSTKKHTFPLGTNFNDPQDTSNTFILEKLISLETFTVDFQEEGEQVIDQQNTKGKVLDKVFQEQGVVENTTEESELEQDDEVSKCPPLDEAIC
jgi:hypothetical protein